MNDALTKDTHEPKTPGDHFVEFRRQEKLIWALEKDLLRLARVIEDWMSAETSVREETLAKQRAVNEELANYIAGGGLYANSLMDALREALKAAP